MVIVCGISISFYVEKQNAVSYKEDLKTESLLKLKNNLLSELEGLHFDYNVHIKAKQYCDIIYTNGLELYKSDKDSLGFYLSYVIKAATLFIENKEEYSALVNSGLIELIENRTLVKLLQEKYASHEWLKGNNQLLLDLVIRETTFDPFLESKNRRRHKNVVAYWTSFKSNKRYLNDSEINIISNRGLFHELYASLIFNTINADSILIKEIDHELSSH